MKKNESDKLYEEILPLAKALKSIYDEIELMVKDGIITREQADDMTGATIDKIEEEKKTKKKGR